VKLERVKNSREIMEILEAYDLTGSYRQAAELAGCDHHTVARYVKMRAAGQSPQARRHRDRAIDAYLPKIEELVVRSNGKIRADIVHKRISAMGFTGGERTTRRTVAEAKAQFRAGQRRVYRPWITEPGLWIQWDWGEGPQINGRRTSLWCDREGPAMGSRRVDGRGDLGTLVVHPRQRSGRPASAAQPHEGQEQRQAPTCHREEGQGLGPRDRRRRT
jgi:hypothetical protein